MKTTYKKTSGNFKIIANGNKQSKQLKEEFPGPTHEDPVFETGKEHDLFKRVGDRPEYLHEEVIKIITKDQPGNG